MNSDKNTITDVLLFIICIISVDQYMQYTLKTLVIRIFSGRCIFVVELM